MRDLLGDIRQIVDLWTGDDNKYHAHDVKGWYGDQCVLSGPSSDALEEGAHILDVQAIENMNNNDTCQIWKDLSTFWSGEKYQANHGGNIYEIEAKNPAEYPIPSMEFIRFAVQKVLAGARTNSALADIFLEESDEENELEPDPDPDQKGLNLNGNNETTLSDDWEDFAPGGCTLPSARCGKGPEMEEGFACI